MNKTYILGCDPGSTGGLCLFDHSQALILGLWSMPNYTKQLTTGKKSVRVDLPKTAELIQSCVDKAMVDDAILYFHIELVAGHPKQSPIGSFQFGYSTGVIAGIASAHQLPLVEVYPQAWKAQFGLIATEKDAARLRVIELFPALAQKLKLKKTSGMADAALIACYKP